MMVNFPADFFQHPATPRGGRHEATTHMQDHGSEEFEGD
jgi:hypothetical protein